MFPVLLSLPERQKRVCMPEHLSALSSYTTYTNKRYKIQICKHLDSAAAVILVTTILTVYLTF